jgi:hypothetical protein
MVFQIPLKMPVQEQATLRLPGCCLHSACVVFFPRIAFPKLSEIKPRPYILNTPNFVSGTGALSAALNDSASTSRVLVGSMMPSSHRRADE